MTCDYFVLAPAYFLEERDGVRLYRLVSTGEVVPSISTVVSLLARDGLRRWSAARVVEHLRATLSLEVGRRLRPEALARALKEAARYPDALAREAAILGSQVHRACQALAVEGGLPWGGELPPVDLESFREWLSQRPGTTWHAELPVGSPTLRVAGQADLVGVLPSGRLVVADVKTSDRPFESHFLQLAGYVLCLQEDGWEVAEAAIVLLPRAGGFRAVPVQDMDRWMRAFEHLAALWHILRGESYES